MNFENDFDDVTWDENDFWDYDGDEWADPWLETPRISEDWNSIEVEDPLEDEDD